MILTSYIFTHVSTCPGNEIFTLTGLRPDTGYTLRWKAPDNQYPDVQVDMGCEYRAVLLRLYISAFFWNFIVPNDTFPTNLTLCTMK